MESEHNEVDGMKKGVDSKGEVMHISPDRKYLRNGSTNQKSDTYLINYISSPIGQKIGELWSTNQKVIGAHVDPPN